MCRVPAIGPHSSTTRDSTRDCEDLKKDEEEATERRDEAQRKGEEDAAGGSTQENVVAEKEHLVGVVMARRDGRRRVHCGETHLSFE